MALIIGRFSCGELDFKLCSLRVLSYCMLTLCVVTFRCGLLLFLEIYPTLYLELYFSFAGKGGKSLPEDYKGERKLTFSVTLKSVRSLPLRYRLCWDTTLLY
jgi:hypothetical protein